MSAQAAVVTAATYSNLYHGARRNDCPPLADSLEGIYDPASKGDAIYGFNYEQAPNLDGYLYDQTQLEPTQTQSWPSSLECAKGAGYIALSRELHVGKPEYSRFRLKEDSRQKDIWRWFQEHKEHIKADYCLNTHFIPKHIELDCIFYRNHAAIPGLTAQLIDFYTDTAIGSVIDFGVVGCKKISTIPAAMRWNEANNRMLSLKLLTVPDLVAPAECAKDGKEGSIDCMHIELSPRVFCPWAGE